MTHEISMTTAGEIDSDWMNAGMPDDGLRIYGLRRSGNKTVTFLGVPGTNGAHPAYVLSNGRYLHVSGPTLDELPCKPSTATQPTRPPGCWRTRGQS